MSLQSARRPAKPISEHAKWLILFLASSFGARALYIFLFPKCHSFDLVSWNTVGDALLAGKNPYNETTLLNWPPFWMQCLYCLKKLALATDIPFVHLVRGLLIGIEGVLGTLLYATLHRYTPYKSPGRLLVWGIALNPLCILQVCQHCNFDVLVGFWVLLAAYLLLRFQEHYEIRFWLCACLAVGMGALTKTVPLALIPLLLVSALKMPLLEQALGAILVFLPISLGLSILYVLGPESIQAHVLGYRSIPNLFGFTGVFSWLGFSTLANAWPNIFLTVYGLAWVLLAIRLLFTDSLHPMNVFGIAAMLLMAIPAFGPGYGPHYIYWFLPLWVLLYGAGSSRDRLFWMLVYAVAIITSLSE